MALDQLHIVQAKQDALDAARSRRAECGEAMEALERVVAAPSDGHEETWRAGVRRTLIKLRKAFIDHLAVTEAPGGLFEEIIKDSPRLIHRTQELREEHTELASAIDGALVSVAREGRNPPIPETREAILDLLSRLDRHRQASSDLVYESLEIDIGGGDD
jgi:hypothetical protein